MDRRYKELIFTNHALERARQRKVDLGAAWATWKRPDKSEYVATKGAWIKKRSWPRRTIEVVVKQNDRKEWVVISVWANDKYTKPRRPWWRKMLKRMWRLLTSSRA